jgi:HD-GYP domain-containing protein (c-di-GMP phosphodiesterase class II)
METITNSAQTVTNLIELAQETHRRFLQSINGLCAAAELSDELTGNHIYRVNEYARVLARDLCGDDELCLRVGRIAAAHDMDKVAVPHIVKLERALSAQEWREMRMHTVYGALQGVPAAAG